MTGLNPWSAWFAPAPARRLATLRVLVGAFAVVYVAIRSPNLVATAGFPGGRFDPVGPVSVLSVPLPVWVAVLSMMVTVGLGVLFVAGRRFALVGPCFALGLLWVLSYRNSWGMVFHTENLLVLHVLVLGLAPSADSHPWEDDDRVGSAYGWPIKLMAAVVVLTYVIAGVAKLRATGLHWATSDVLRNYVAFDNVRKAEAGALYSPVAGLMVRNPWIFPPLALGSLALELLAPVALLHRGVARVWCLLAWGFHVGVALVMWILFPYPLLGVAYAPFFRVERGWERVQAWFTRNRKGQAATQTR